MRISLTDNSSRWFNDDTAKIWREATIRVPEDPDACVSRVTGNSWEHERLYLTEHGSFIMCYFNERNLSATQFILVPPATAIKWLLANDYADEVPKLEYEKELREFEI